MRPDVQAAVRAALEFNLDEGGIAGHNTREIVIRSSLENEAEGCNRYTLLRAIEIILDGVARAFPIVIDPQMKCLECGMPPLIARRDDAGTVIEWQCRDGHRWVTGAPEGTLPGPNVPMQAKDLHRTNWIEEAVTSFWVEGVFSDDEMKQIRKRAANLEEEGAAKVAAMMAEIADENDPGLSQ